MKVRRFRLRPRPGIVARMVRSQMSLKHLPEDLEQQVPELCDRMPLEFSPVALYRTWGASDVPATLGFLSEEPHAERAVAVSMLVATIGQRPEKWLSKALLAGETGRGQVMTAICEDGADLAIQFLYRLLSDDAKGDDCDVSDLLPVTDAERLAFALKGVEAGQDGIGFDAAKHLSPRFTRVAAVFWQPVSKRKRMAPSPKKRAF